MEDYITVSESIKSKLSFLSKYDLEYKNEKIESSGLVEEKLQINFFSEKRGIEISISYSGKRKNIPQHFSVYISSKGKEGFALQRYLEQKNAEHNIKNFYNICNKELSEFCSQFALSLKKICDENISDLLNGKSWDVKPLDFSPYR